MIIIVIYSEKKQSLSFLILIKCSGVNLIRSVAADFQSGEMAKAGGFYIFNSFFLIFKIYFIIIFFLFQLMSTKDIV